MGKGRVLIAGAGPAGLVAAFFAAEGGAAVDLLERNDEAGRKLGLTGGGRCNILPAAADPSSFSTCSSRNSLRRILRSWTPEAARAFFEQTAGVPLCAEASTGKLFPVSQRAVDVRDALLGLAVRSGARIVMGCRADCAGRLGDGAWEVRSEPHGLLPADKLVLATGGCSWPETGSDGMGLEMARSMGHRIHPPKPALVPLLSSEPRWGELAGLTLEVSIRNSAGKPLTKGNLLVTHAGFSGPAVLDASHLWESGLRVQWCPMDAASWDEALRSGRGRVLTLLRGRLPERLSALLLEMAGLSHALGFSDLRREGRQRLVEALSGYLLPISGTLGWPKAEVTAGGVDLEEVGSDTLESRISPGLFFAGEILDCFGAVGGYNLYWAFLTGRLAGTGAAK